jgi:hypothetical protein
MAVSTEAYSTTMKDAAINLELHISLFPTVKMGTNKADVAIETVCTLLVFIAAEFTPLLMFSSRSLFPALLRNKTVCTDGDLS